MHVHVRFYTRPHRNINTHIFNAKGSKQIQNNHVSFRGVDENNDNRDEGDGGPAAATAAAAGARAAEQGVSVRFRNSF